MKTNRLEQFCEVCGAAKELDLDSGYVPGRLGVNWPIQRLVRETNPQLLGPEKSAEIVELIQKTTPDAHRLAMLTSFGFRINDLLTDYVRWRQRILWGLLIKGVVAGFAAVWLLEVSLGVLVGMILFTISVAVMHLQFRKSIRTKIWPRFQGFLSATEIDAESVGEFFENRGETMCLTRREFGRYLRANSGSKRRVNSARQDFRAGFDFFRPNL